MNALRQQLAALRQQPKRPQVRPQDALIACRAKAICYGHFGIREDGAKMLKIHRNQLLFWEERIKDEMNHHQAHRTEDQVTACLKRLLNEDPLMATFNQLPPDIQKRETYFLKNSISGYIGWLGSEDRGQRSEVRK